MKQKKSFFQRLFGGGQDSPEAPKEKKSTKEYDKTAPFPWDERTSLVIYAARTLDDNPDNSFPSLIFHDHDNKTSGLISDGAPYLTVLTAGQMRGEMMRWKQRAKDKRDGKMADEAATWVESMIAKGWPAFLYETEPPEYAGNAYPWAWYQDQNG